MLSASAAFYVNASKKLICPECKNSFDISRVLSMIKNKTH